MAISEIKVQGWRAIPTQCRKARKSQRTLKIVTANVISITGKEYVMYISNTTETVVDC